MLLLLLLMLLLMLLLLLLMLLLLLLLSSPSKLPNIASRCAEIGSSSEATSTASVAPDSG